MKTLTFEEAIADAQDEKGKKHLLLGNGFSIALDPSIFTYTALLDQAKQLGRLSGNAIRVFDALRTTDFEVIIRALQHARTVSRVYLDKSDIRSELLSRLKDDVDSVRDTLARTISDNHPDRPSSIDVLRYASCRRFLGNFDGCIYTLNYDLLLYWTLMQDTAKPHINHDDGFRTPDDGEQEYVTWDIEKTDGQNIFYVHGALHIYDQGAELQKFTWKNTQIPLIDQIRGALDQGRFPLIVAEGCSDDKLAKIMHSNYLSRAYRSFAKISGCLFIYGHSLADTDEHILNLISKNTVKRLYVGLYQDPASPGNQKLIARAMRLAHERSERRPLKVRFFDAASAHVWDSLVRPRRRQQ